MDIYDGHSILCFMIQQKFDVIDRFYWNHEDPDIRESMRRTWMRVKGRPPNGVQLSSTEDPALHRM